MTCAFVAVSLLAACAGTGTGRGETQRSARGDADGDRIVGHADHCPSAAEDEDGFQDADGCPDPDDDGDRRLDADDLCRCIAEDLDGFEDADGCPDEDNDRDRIVDACDHCPNEPETYNGCADEDGCPDHAHVCVAESRIVIIEYIYFRTRESTLRVESEPLLEALAATINGNPQIERVRLVGHADGHEAGGDTPAAARLALARAESVRAALVARGVAPERLLVEERGAREPLAVEHTSADRERNRRVGFEVARVDGRDVPPGASTDAASDAAATECGRCAEVQPACATPPPPPRDVCAGG